MTAEEFMDDGTPIKLAITIDRAARTALLDFTGAHANVIMIAPSRPTSVSCGVFSVKNWGTHPRSQNPRQVCSHPSVAGTGPEVFGNCNAPPAVTYSAAIYCLRCLVGADIPLNQVRRRQVTALSIVS